MDMKELREELGIIQEMLDDNVVLLAEIAKHFSHKDEEEHQSEIISNYYYAAALARAVDGTNEAAAMRICGLLTELDSESTGAENTSKK